MHTINTQPLASICQGFIACNVGHEHTSCAVGLAAGSPDLSSSGCTKLSDTFVYTNPDYSTLKTVLTLPSVGLNNTLAGLKSPTTWTLFAPNNEPFATYTIGGNVSNAEALSSPLLPAGAVLLVVPEAFSV